METKVTEEKQGKGTKYRFWKIYGILFLMVAVFTGICWLSTGFCGFYIRHIFPIWVNTYGRFTGLFPFSVGEWLIVDGLLLVAVAVCLIPVGLFSGKRFTKFYRFFAGVIMAVLWIMTLNCVVLYHAPTFSETYFADREDVKTEENLVKLWNEVAQKCNELSLQVERDEYGRIIYPYKDLSEDQEEAMRKKARLEMKRMGEKYPNLSGYYPDPKPMFFSDFMCQQYMCGYYFPFSMEANYNQVMYIMNKPSTMCHELSHLKGYIYEDEANFISYVACIESDDIYFQYSGYLSVLNYIAGDLYKVSKENYDSFIAKGYQLTKVSKLVQNDDAFVLEEDWNRIEEKAVIETAVVEKAADTFVDTTLKVNGVNDGKQSYGRVVNLLLNYYADREEKLQNE